MKVYGIETVAQLLESDEYLFKLTANDLGAVLFPYRTEHRDATQSGITYADNSKGNALAAMVKPGRVEFRHHQRFSDERVRALWIRLLTIPEFGFATSFSVTYQGRSIYSGTGHRT